MSAAEDVLAQALALTPPERAKLIARIADSLAESPAASAPTRRRFGSAAGRVRLREDFAAPLADFTEYT